MSLEPQRPAPLPRRPVRVAAAADIHYARPPNPTLAAMLPRVSEDADVLLLCGDLTDHGLPEEAAGLAREFAAVRIPVLAVLGNHDCHSDRSEEILRVLADSPIRVLDGDAHEVMGVGFAGVKGFGSGFGRRILEPWGEASVRAFVREAVEEALRLETALARLSRVPRVAFMHYAPIVETVLGEPPEIQPFLGTSRLEEPINRFQVVAAFHGHAHHGRAEGRTSTGIPVFNVSAPLLRHADPARPPYRVVEIPVSANGEP